MSKVILPGDADFNTGVWIPPEERERQAAAAEPPKPNRAQRRAIKRRTKLRNDGTPKEG